MIHTTITHNDQEYSGFLCPIPGAGREVMYHFYVDGYYYGQLFKTEVFGWRFGSNKGWDENEYSILLGGWVELMRD